MKGRSLGSVPFFVAAPARAIRHAWAAASPHDVGTVVVVRRRLNDVVRPTWGEAYFRLGPEAIPLPTAPWDGSFLRKAELVEDKLGDKDRDRLLGPSLFRSAQDPQVHCEELRPEVRALRKTLEQLAKVRDQALTVTFSLMVSVAVALLLQPVLSARILRASEERPRGIFRLFQWGAGPRPRRLPPTARACSAPPRPSSRGDGPRPHGSRHLGREPGSQLSPGAQARIAGVEATFFNEVDQRIDIAIRLPLDERLDLHHALATSIPLAGGQRVPLASFLSLAEERPFRELKRRHQQRWITISGNVEGRRIDAVWEEVRAVAEGVLPGGVQVIEEGERKEMKRSFRDLGMAMILAVLLVYMILAGQFDSSTRSSSPP